MSYVVYQNGIPADNEHYPNMKGKFWESSSFSSKREAEIYAFMWAFPVPYEYAKEYAPETELGKEEDCRQCWDVDIKPVMIKIEKVDM